MITEEMQTIFFWTMGIIIAVCIITSCTYSINVMQSKGKSKDAIEEQQSEEIAPQFTLPSSLLM